MPRIAVVGAGVAGLTVAYGLRTRPLDVTIFEKSRGFGGRAATRGRYGCRYDHGAVSFGATTDRVERLVTGYLPTEHLIEIGRPVWSFDETGTVHQSPAASEGQRRWSYVNGISTLGKLLARHSRAEVCREHRIERLTRREQQWTLHTDGGRAYPGYDAVVLAAPAPQTADILAQSGGAEAALDRAQKALLAVPYAPQFSYILAYDRRIERPGAVHGLTSSDDEHPIDWIGFENDKPGHVQPGQTLLVVQTAPGWTEGRVNEDPGAFLSEVKAEAREVLSADLRQPAWYDTQRWRYARPLAAVPEDRSRSGEAGLFFAGDAVAGTGKVSAAIETGFDAAARVRQHLGE